MPSPLVISDIWSLVDRADTLPWQPFRPGVEIHRLYGDGTGAAAALLRYEPGAQVPHHDHTGYEHIFVLSGSQRDRHQTYPAGSLVINAPGTDHAVASDDGCLVLVIWERPVALREADSPPSSPDTASPEASTPAAVKRRDAGDRGRSETP